MVELMESWLRPSEMTTSAERGAQQVGGARLNRACKRDAKRVDDRGARQHDRLWRDGLEIKSDNTFGDLLKDCLGRLWLLQGWHPVVVLMLSLKSVVRAQTSRLGLTRILRSRQARVQVVEQVLFFKDLIG